MRITDAAVQTGFEGYMRIVDFFDKDDTAGSFLNEDGEGGFLSGISRMAREIDRLRATVTDDGTKAVDVGELSGNSRQLKSVDVAANDLSEMFDSYSPTAIELLNELKCRLESYPEPDLDELRAKCDAAIEALSAEPAQGDQLPKERVCIPDPNESSARIVGFRIRKGDEAWGEHGLSEPLFWLGKLLPAAPTSEAEA